MQKFGRFDENGMPLAFYTEEIHGGRMIPVYGVRGPKSNEDGSWPEPEIIGEGPNLLLDGTVDLTEDQWREFIENQGQRRWDGKAVVEYTSPPPAPIIPATVMDYQFAGQAAAEKIITFEEAMAWTARGEIPAVLLDAVDQAVTDPDRRGSVLLFLAGSKDYPRHHPLTPILGPLLGKNDDAALDAFWIAAAAR